MALDSLLKVVPTMMAAAERSTMSALWTATKHSKQDYGFSPGACLEGKRAPCDQLHIKSSYRIETPQETVAQKCRSGFAGGTPQAEQPDAQAQVQSKKLDHMP